MGTETATVIFETGKLLLQGYFAYMRMNGATQEEAAQLYKDAKATFDANPPEYLPDA